MEEIRVGDIVEMVDMPDDPDPIPQGTKGEVQSVTTVQIVPSFTQVGVKWENGRTLSVIIPPDTIRVVE